MSKIDELLSELCPDGVPFYDLDSVFDLKNGYTPSKKNPSYWDNGTVNWFRMEDIRANGHVLSSSLQKIAESGVKGGKLFAANSLIVATSATIGEHALITTPFMCNQRFTCLTLKAEYADKLDMKFVFYYADLLDTYCLENTNSGGFESVSMTAFRKFQFPVPPLEVQREVVRALDSFAELEAELEARRAQYRYYRDKLLSFDRERELNG
ncbi:restriction endonuclease subunit S [uncultured Parolsenella sp.]|uniref:restriction endonuclease subunit S n=1 Tax=uncultured Parolsenella sp. TaxID=2083008 RepID=UPI0025D4E1F0|nr:restriction endonuclease subunit S [uncultured Parolsenella sp.]